MRSIHGGRRAQQQALRPAGFRRIGTLAVVTVLAVGSSVGPATTANAAVLTLRSQAARLGILIGSGAINPAYLDEPQFAQVLAQQFNSLSPENELKWSFSEPQRGVFDFTKLDRLVGFAKQNHMAVKGHGLISGCCNPAWLEQIQTPDELRAAMTTHFNTIMRRYAGRVDRWDVATEVLSTFG